MEKLRQGDPESIGPYSIIARLGAGGMGVVFLATRGAERVALKVVRSSFLDDPSLRTRFEREIETLKKVSSPFVAKIIDSSIEGEIAWHAVEFVNGPTLRELVDANGPLSSNNWWALASQLQKAVEAIHELRIVHRDIKPSNIIMSETGPKLIDFGISQDSEATSLTGTGMVAGSPAWLSPEQLEGSEIGAGSDLFSVGSVLTFAATGRSPWGDETSLSVPVMYKRILSGDSFTEVPAEFLEAVSALMEAEPRNRRFTSRVIQEADSDQPSMSHFHAALESKSELIQGGVKSFEVRSGTTAQKTSRALLAVGGSITVAVSLGIALITSDRELEDPVSETTISNSNPAAAIDCAGLSCYVTDVTAERSSTGVDVEVAVNELGKDNISDVSVTFLDSWGGALDSGGYCPQFRNPMTRTSLGWQISCPEATLRSPENHHQNLRKLARLEATLTNGERVAITTGVD